MKDKMANLWKLISKVFCILGVTVRHCPRIQLCSPCREENKKRTTDLSNDINRLDLTSLRVQSSFQNFPKKQTN